MRHITLDDVRAMTKTVVDEDPDYRYKTTRSICMYRPSGIDGRRCLVGEVMYRLGVNLDAYISSFEDLQFEDIRIEDSDYPYATERVLVAEPGDYQTWRFTFVDVTIDYAAVVYLDQAQEVQDVGKTWGQAYEYAETQVFA